VCMSSSQSVVGTGALSTLTRTCLLTNDPSSDVKIDVDSDWEVVDNRVTSALGD